MHSCHLLWLAEAEELTKVHGLNELEEKSIPKWLIFVKIVRSRPCGCWRPVHCQRMHGVFTDSSRWASAVACLPCPHPPGCQHRQ